MYQQIPPINSLTGLLKSGGRKREGWGRESGEREDVEGKGERREGSEEGEGREDSVR